MKIKCDDSVLINSIKTLNEYLHIKIDSVFKTIEIKKDCESLANCQDGNLKIYYESLNQVFALLGQAMTKNGNFTILYNVNFEKTGIMLDCARNAVIKLEQAKKMIALSALLGYNYFELYVEDCLEVDNEPYFGYMRGRFSQSEIIELDGFSKNYGVELVPCVQTLAHLARLFFHWREYYSIQDKGDVLLVGEPRTYELIENIIKTCRKCFTSNRINIGMDEAFDLGQGKYFDKNGFEPKSTIIRKHLKKVLEICKKYSFNSEMWADMFYEDMREQKTEEIPKDVELIYWEYSDSNKETHDKMFKLLQQSKCKYSFAGGAIKWLGFAPFNRVSKKCLSAQAASAIENGVKNFLLTLWGDDGADAAHFSVIPALCYFSSLNYSIDSNYVEEICKVISGYTYSQMCHLDDVNRLYDGDDVVNPSRYLFYADPLIGVEEVAALADYPEKYKKISDTLYKLCQVKSQFTYLFETMHALSRFLELKSYIVEELYFAYKAKDNKALKKCLEKLSNILLRLDDFILLYEKQWNTESKALGFEVQQIRLYGMRGRTLSIINRLQSFLDGNLDKIEELEEEKYFAPLKDINNKENYKGQLYNLYVANTTYCKI